MRIFPGHRVSSATADLFGLLGGVKRCRENAPKGGMIIIRWKSYKRRCVSTSMFGGSLSFCRVVSLSLCRPVSISCCLSVFLSFSISASLSFWLSGIRSSCFCAPPYVCQSVCLSVCHSVCMPVCVSVCMCVRLSVSLCLSVSLPPFLPVSRPMCWFLYCVRVCGLLVAVLCSCLWLWSVVAAVVVTISGR